MSETSELQNSIAEGMSTVCFYSCIHIFTVTALGIQAVFRPAVLEADLRIAGIFEAQQSLARQIEEFDMSGRGRVLVHHILLDIYFKEWFIAMRLYLAEAVHTITLTRDIGL